MDEHVEVAGGTAAVVEVRGNKKVLHAPRKDVPHNPHHPSHVLELDWVYPLQNFAFVLYYVYIFSKLYVYMMNYMINKFYVYMINTYICSRWTGCIL